MKDYPLAIISSSLGKRSETFIHRHMAELLPGKTVVLTRRMAPHLDDLNILFPYFILEHYKYNLKWFLNRIYFLTLYSFNANQSNLAKYLKKYCVKTILSEYLNMSLEWLEVAQKMRIRFFTHAHGYDISRMLCDPVMRHRYLQFEKADGIITMSEFSKKKLIDIGLSGKNIHVIPYGIDIPNSPNIKKSDDMVHCLAVGRFVNKKAPTLTLEAFRIASSIDTRLRLDYIGDGMLFDKAKQFIYDHSLQNIVTLHGSQPNQTVQDFMKNADIFIQHSITDPLTGDEEGLPVAILEAMANSLPIVSTRHAGIPEAVIDGVTGYLVDEGDKMSMATNILKLSNNQRLRRKLGYAGWDRAKQFFAWEKEKSDLLKLLQI